LLKPPNAFYRIIDANINRLKEGLRVCEEITRFILNSRSLTTAFKDIRHRIDGVLKCLPPTMKIIPQRKSLKDVGREVYIHELKRKNYQDIFFANIQRVKESFRVLEEFTKLLNVKTALDFKRLRYAVYELEKKVARKISALRHHR
jgi:thiamine-phosphate pyrophosphorylase